MNRIMGKVTVVVSGHYVLRVDSKTNVFVMRCVLNLLIW